MTIMNHDFSSGAILWHCTEGKDRCGLVTALVLEIECGRIIDKEGAAQEIIC